MYSDSCVRDHPYLLSFPTRRSSDLQAVIGTTSLAKSEVNRENGMLAMPQRTTSPAPMEVSKSPHFEVVGVSRRTEVKRSEEHTSELQSHVNLVCRLLLEKKNKNTYA